MRLRLKYNNKFKNLSVVFILILYILFLYFIDKSDGTSIILMTLILISITFIVSISRLFLQKNILDPSVWFLPIFSLVSLISCIFAFTDNNMYWFEPYRVIFQEQARFYLLLNAVALIGFYLGNILIFQKKNNLYGSKEIKFSSIYIKTLLKRILFFLIFLIGITYYSLLISGGLDMMAQNRGIDQFSGYGGIIYFLTVLSNLLYFFIVSYSIPLLFIAKKKKYFLLFFILMGIYLFPSIYIGTRSATVFLIIALLLNYFVFHENSSKIINFKTLLLFLFTFALLIVFFGFIRNIQGESFSVYLLNFFGEMQLSSGVGMTTVHLFPDTHPYFYGGTYISAFFNLIPNIFFGGARPFVNPSLVFHELFAPEMMDLGFGFSIFAEAYMNGGLISVFVFFFLFSIGLSSFFLNPHKTILRMAMVSLIFLAAMWFLRGDSTSFFKTFIFGYLFFKIISYRKTKIRV